jgi:hypothetical protein
MADQRFTGLPLEELRAMAMRGDPEAAGRAGQRLDRAGAVLRQVAADLERAAERIGLGWRGGAAEAARTGIAGHAGWATAAGGRVATAGAAARAQADSARHVRQHMPDPATLPPRAVPAAGGAGPARGDLARVDLGVADEAWRNAQLRAVELLNGHAANSRAQLPHGSGPAPAAPGSPVRAAMADGVSAVAAGGLRLDRVPVAGEPVPVVTAAAAAPVGIAPVPGLPAGPASAGPAWGGAAAPVLGVPVGPSGGGAPAGGVVRSGLGATSPAAVTGVGRGGSPPVDAGRRGGPPLTGSAAGVRPSWFPPRGGQPGTGAAGTGPVGTGTVGTGAAGTGAGGAATGVSGHGTGVTGTGGPGSGGSGTGVVGHGGRDEAGSAGPNSTPAAPPLMPTSGGATAYAGHERLGFLLDGDEVFDGDEPVSPPVLGS